MSCARRGFKVAVVLSVFLLTTTRDAAAQALMPVSWLLRASASASDGGGTTSDNPPDNVQGAVFGSFSQSATATSPQGAARGSALMDVRLAADNTLPGGDMLYIHGGAGAQILAQGATSAFGSSAGTLTVDVSQPITLSETAFTTGLQTFGNYEFRIYRSNGTVLHSVVFQPSTNFSNQLINLPPDRYAFSMSGSRGFNAGTSAGAGGVVEFKLVPEPASLCSIAACVGAAQLLRRRRH